jgi:2-polyprenyl-3-methyl-5-hydroxy-6-metoxy-1,4-benzoquinol methylase
MEYNNINQKQKKQESQYSFPYHYLPENKDNYFFQTKNLFWGYEYVSYLEFVLDKIQDLKFESILDIGCGDGRLLYEINKRKIAKKIVGYDYSEKPLLFAKAFGHGEKISFLQKDIIKEPQTESFDLVSLIEVIEHIPLNELDCFIKNAIKHLNINGKLIITVPSDNLPVIKKHEQHFNLNKLKQYLEKYVQIENIYFLNSKSFFVKKILSRLFSNKLFILNNQKISTIFYKFYKKYFLISTQKKCSRIMVICKKK